MKRKRIGKLALVLPVYLILTYILYKWHPVYADYFVRCLAPFGTIGAVCVALFLENVKSWLNPIDIQIEVLSEAEQNKHTDLLDGRQVYCHHVRVKNLASKKTVENCRAWLKRVWLVDDPRSRHEEIIFAVPRLMEWSPSEYSPDKRTFVKDQILDLGQTLDANDGFRFTLYNKQEAAIEFMKNKFRPGAVIRCVIYATADNYHDQKEFTFEITVGSTVHFKVIEPSKVIGIQVS